MSFKVIAGDFPTHASFTSTFGNGCYIVSGWNDEVKLDDHIKSAEILTEESKKKFMGAAGWGLVGAAALGPLGLIAGVLAGGNKKEICFACELKDGRKFMAIADSSTFHKINALVFNKSTLNNQVITTENLKCSNCNYTIREDWNFCPSCTNKLK